MYKVLFHLNDEGRAGDVFGNIENLIKDIGSENLEIELVVHSDGVYPFKKDRNDYNKRVIALIEKGVQINVCGNTLKKNHMKLENFTPGIEMVSSSVGEIVRKQSEGWLYIKP